MKSRNFLNPLFTAFLLIFVFYFCFLPILSVILYGLNSSEQMVGLSEVLRAFGLLQHSVLLGFAVTVSSLFFGIITAFTLHRLKFRGRSAMKVLMLLPLVNPAFVGSISFIMLFGRRGLITYRMLGLNVSPFGWQGVFFLQTIGFTTLAYLIISGAVRHVDTNLEDAARNLGANEKQVFFRITLPMMKPEIASAGLLVFLGSMSDFTTPMVIGGNFRTLATDLYLQITGQYNMQLASISGIVLLIPCFLVFYLQSKYANRQSYLGDQSQSIGIEYTNILPLVAKSLILLILAMMSVFILNFLFVFVGAFTVSWGSDYSFTFAHLNTVLQSEPQKYLKPLLNSILLAITTGLGSALLGVIAAYLNERRRLKGGRLLETMAMLPAAVPGILFGVGCLVTFKYPFFGIGRYLLPDLEPVILLGTTAILYLVCIARNIHVSMKTCYAILQHIDPDIENAARNLGAGEAYIYHKITLPLLKDAFINSFIKIFSSTMTSLGVIIFLLMPSNKVIVQVLFQSMTGGLSLGVPAVLALMLSGLTLLLMLLFQLLAYGKSVILKIGRLNR